MKRFILFFTVIIVSFIMTACNDTNNFNIETTESTVITEDIEENIEYEIALIIDLGSIEDKSFNQSAWVGILQYAVTNNITHKYYQTASQDEEAYLDAIDIAVKNGAKLIVTPGYFFETPVYLVQDKYPDVHFILLDGSPHNADYTDYKTNSNTVGINYAEEQSGFLAGYAAVKEGYTELGFMGGMDFPSVMRYGYGFIQGAEYAAKELNLKPNSIAINYQYTNTFEASPRIQEIATAWYSNGTEVIFACGGTIGLSIMEAAEETNNYVIGVDVDQSVESDTVITSALKGIKASVYYCISDFYNNNFPGGQTLILRANNEGISLPMETSVFTNFTQEDYDAIFSKLIEESITIVRDVDENNTTVELSDFQFEYVTITEMK